jgi:hypothetical protein
MTRLILPAEALSRASWSKDNALPKTAGTPSDRLSRFRLPSACSILSTLFIIGALTWLIPAGQYGGAL